MMSLHRSMHSSQMNTDGPAISLRTSCWLLLQNEQWRTLASAEPFFSGINMCIAYISGRARSGPAQALASRRLGSPGGQHLVDQPIRYRIRRGHEVVTLGILGDALDRLAGVLGQDLVQALAQLEDFARLDLDVGGLTLGAARGLVDHDAGIGQRK